VLATAAIVNGCSLSGTWRTVSVVPEGERFPIVSVTFDKQHRFTATSEEDARQRTSTGEYKWNGLRLILSPGHGQEQEQKYRGRRRLDGTLVLTHRVPGIRIKATLERTGH
jgi:hypothetical protein